MPSFLIELFSEEIPARMQEEAVRALRDAFVTALQAAHMPFTGLKSFVTPRRLAFTCAGLPSAQPDRVTEKKGPKTSAPQAALEGFLRSSGLTLEQLEKRMVGKDEVYFAVIQEKGSPAAELLKAIAEKILADFSWPKSMRWGSGETRWVRPLHSILCLLDGEVVPVEFAGLTAGDVTRGHRFLAPEAITIARPEEYEAALEKAYVIADAEARRERVRAEAEAEAARHGLEVRQDKGLLAEVTGLVEWPVVLSGRIDARFMDLPAEVLISEMRAHQKYFALEKNGYFSDRFLITANTETQDGGKAVVAGNERVLRARLADGRFFWDQDRKKPLAEWARSLEGVTFHARLGSVARKVERVARLAVLLAGQVPGADVPQVERAARLCKADLATGMVGEFPELQGVMGRYYALDQGEAAPVADAIRDHYLPLGPDSPVPNRPVSVCVALADKLDTLVSLWSAGEKPTGSKDPFALRRMALGIIRIVLENKLRLRLSAILSEAKDLARNASASPQHDGLKQEVLSFFADRLKVQLKGQGVRHDVIAAVMADGDGDLVRVVAKAQALQEFLATQDGIALLAAYRRAGNIVAIEEKKDALRYDGQVKAGALAQAEEQALYGELETVGPKVENALEKEHFTAAMSALSALREPVDRFFDQVMVNAPEPGLRANRLQLLSRIRGALDGIADFSLVEGL